MAISAVQKDAIALYVEPREDGTRRTITEVMEEVNRDRGCWYKWLKKKCFMDELDYVRQRADSLLYAEVNSELRARLRLSGFSLVELVKLQQMASDKKEDNKGVSPVTIVLGKDIDKL